MVELNQGKSNQSNHANTHSITFPPPSLSPTLLISHCVGEFPVLKHKSKKVASAPDRIITYFKENASVCTCHKFFKSQCSSCTRYEEFLFVDPLPPFLPLSPFLLLSFHFPFSLLPLSIAFPSCLVCGAGI